jgi:Bacteriocin-protection, YdeI or OmpD-Associated/Domain of unknown function (DUF1905)
MAIEFSSVLAQAEGMTATGIPVPDDVVEKLGGPKNAAVAVRVRKARTDAEWYEYRISLATRGGYIMSFSSANRSASGLVAGDPLEVSIELDTAPRTVEIPDDLRAVLDAAGALDAFRALSYSHQRAHIEPIVAAKAPETRARRIEKTLAILAG